MHKKILAICAALVAFAIVPAFASASPVLTEEGKAVGATAGITATNEGEIIFTTSAGKVFCNKSTLSGTLTTNSGSEIAGNVENSSYTGTGEGGKCTSEFLGQITVDTAENLPWCIKAGGKLTADTFEIRGGKCSETARNLTFTLTGGLGTCRYTRANVTGSITTNSDTKELVIGASQTFTKEEVSSALCPTSGTITGTYNLETSVSPFTSLTIS